MPPSANSGAADPAPIVDILPASRVQRNSRFMNLTAIHLIVTKGRRMHKNAAQEAEWSPQKRGSGFQELRPARAHDGTMTGVGNNPEARVGNCLGHFD